MVRGKRDSAQDLHSRPGSEAPLLDDLIKEFRSEQQQGPDKTFKALKTLAVTDNKSEGAREMEVNNQQQSIIGKSFFDDSLFKLFKPRKQTAADDHSRFYVRTKSSLVIRPNST